MVNHYDESTKTITLVTDFKYDNDGKPKFKTKEFLFPIFVKGVYTKKAIQLGKELEENNYVVPEDLFDRLTAFIVDMYGKQFTTDQLVDGIHQGTIIETYIAILMGALRGDSKNE